MAVISLGALPKGRQLRVWRTALGLKQTELARLVNVPQPRLAQIEVGRHRMAPATAARYEGLIEEGLQAIARERGLAFVNA